MSGYVRSITITVEIDTCTTVHGNTFHWEPDHYGLLPDADELGSVIAEWAEGRLP